MNESKRYTGFEWDAGNAEKNWIRHRVSPSECEQAFFNRPLVVEEDTLHSEDEPRFYALGQTDGSRYLFLVYTLRGQLIRVISARDMTPKERRSFERVKAEELEAGP